VHFGYFFLQIILIFDISIAVDILAQVTEKSRGFCAFIPIVINVKYIA